MGEAGWLAIVDIYIGPYTDLPFRETARCRGAESRHQLNITI